MRRDAEDIALQAEDFEVHEEEHLTSCATVLAIDISHSMILYGEDRFTPGQEGRARDGRAHPVEVPQGLDRRPPLRRRREARPDLRDLQDAGRPVPHQHQGRPGARPQAPRQHRKNPNKQVFLITDGKPSAIWERGRLYKNPFGLDLKIVNRTLEEADACRRDGITITTFMIATDTYLVEFVDKLTKINRGRAYYASPYNLAEFLFTDYIRNRKKFLH